MTKSQVYGFLILFVIAAMAVAIFVPKFLRGNCIVAGAKISTPSGQVLIENLLVGDSVLTENLRGERETGTVLGKSEHSATSYFLIRLDDGTTLKTTAEHPVATNKGWRKTDSLQKGDIIFTTTGRQVVQSIDLHQDRVRVFDLTIQPNPNFFANGVLVHNKMIANSTAAAAGCRAIAEAQAIYFRTDYDKDGIQEYSTAFSGDGSLLETKSGLMDLYLIDAASAHANPITGKPKHGYYFKILTAQGEHAKGGKMSYIENGNMTKGFAVLAYPADSSNKNAFIISHDWVIYQQEWNENPVLRAQSINEFNPDSTWIRSE